MVGGKRREGGQTGGRLGKIWGWQAKKRRRYNAMWIEARADFILNSPSRDIHTRKRGGLIR